MGTTRTGVRRLMLPAIFRGGFGAPVDRKRSASGPANDPAARKATRKRILLWALLISAIFGALEAGEPLEDVLKAGRDWVRARPASGSIVVVGVDDRTGERFGGFSFSRTVDARLIDRLFVMGARRVFFDRVYADATTREGDRAFAAALARHPGRVFLGAISPHRPDGQRVETLPREEFQKVADYRSLNGVNTPFLLSANLTVADRFNGRLVPSLSSTLADREVLSEGYYRPDWSVRIKSVPTVSFIDILDGRVAVDEIAGKDVIVGPVSPSLQDIHPILFQGQNPGVYFHVIGAETLRRGSPQSWGWFPAYGCAIVFSILFLINRRKLTRTLSVAAATVFFLLLPGALSERLIDVDVVPAMVLFAVVAYRGSTLLRLEHSRHTNPSSNLPNLLAMADGLDGRRQPLVALKVRNHAQLVSSFRQDVEHALFQELCRRIQVAGDIDEIYHGEDALFWFAPQPVGEELINHIRGLHKLLNPAVVLNGREVDVLTSFGIDADEDRPIKSRVASAALCAEEAGRTNEIWKVYDAQRSHTAAWQLSLMSRLEFAIEQGEMWVAYQPKVSLSDGRIIGAEALVRWQHPMAGALRPDQFVSAAEAHNRIAELTYFVLDRSLRDLASLLDAGHDLGVAVNLSPQMLQESDLLDRVTALLDRHGVAPGSLTLELTETGDLLSASSHIELMGQLVSAGVQLSVDDYGTGNATLEYLAKLPSQEVKIDRTFITDLDSNDQNLILVRSTLEMAHRLGRKVVAEGVEREEEMDVLRDLGCDIAQGYLLSKPVPLAELVLMLDRDRPLRRVRVVIS